MFRDQLGECYEETSLESELTSDWSTVNHFIGSEDEPEDPGESEGDDVGEDDDDHAESDEFTWTPNSLEVARGEEERGCGEDELWGISER